MATKKSITIDFNNTTAQARELDECAEELVRVERQLQSLVDELGQSWKGESANAYYQKCIALKEKIDRSVRNLRQTSTAIKRTAKLYYDAEMKALELARTDSSGGGFR